MSQNSAVRALGQEVIALLKALDLSDWEQMDIPDVNEWVR
jgi:hypothetical protein